MVGGVITRTGVLISFWCEGRGGRGEVGGVITTGCVGLIMIGEGVGCVVSMVGTGRFPVRVGTR